MSQRQQLERLMVIDRSIREGGYPTAERLAKMLEVSRRVIFNDREFMINRLGAPIEFDRQHGGWIYADKTWILPGMIVSEGELLAFFLSVEISKRYLGSSMESSLRSAVEKISKGVKGPVSVDLNTLRSQYTFSAPTFVSSNEQALIDIHHAIYENKSIWVQYFTASRGELTERTINPYHLYNVSGDWYLIGFDELRHEFRTFSMARINKWKIMNEKFERDPSFSAQTWVENSFQAQSGGAIEDISIRFSPETAHYVRERIWHSSQTIDEQEDGGLILHFQTAGLDGIKRWLLTFGHGAEVLTPASFRQEFVDEISKTAKVYRIM